MSFFSSEHITKLISADGYWWLAIIIALESAGIPLPGEITLLVAGAYAGTTHQLDIGFVIASATAGTIVGANLGFWIGQEVGYPLLLRFGRYLGLNEPRIKVGQYLFLRYGDKVVFFGRFFALLRTLSAPLAGVNRMPWRRFFAASTAGGVVWTSLYGLGAYYLGEEATKFARPFAIGFGVAGVVGVAIIFLMLRRHESEFAAKAELALPGPLRPLHEHSRPEA
jgi:membrane protein DedA with SNARE-associated domain